MRRVVRLPKENRVLKCPACEWSCRVVSSAMSSQCENCGTYLDLRNYRIVGANGDPIFTFGSVEFASTAQYRSWEVVADQIFVAGRVHSGLRAFTSIELQERGSVRGCQRAPLIRVAERADVVAVRIEADTLDVQGVLRADTIVLTGTLKVHPGAAVVAREIICGGLDVARGAALQGKLTTQLPAREADMLNCTSQYDTGARAAQSVLVAEVSEAQDASDSATEIPAAQTDPEMAGQPAAPAESSGPALSDMAATLPGAPGPRRKSAFLRREISPHRITSRSFFASRVGAATPSGATSSKSAGYLG
ncbi:hypothetical protein DB346_21735 [Verrucomicrobia bacterium LW23]|nr:hypothetical protein DB346_21735 [Verrucomicrobia bacterium LW23]